MTGLQKSHKTEYDWATEESLNWIWLGYFYLTRCASVCRIQYKNILFLDNDITKYRVCIDESVDKHTYIHTVIAWDKSSFLATSCRIPVLVFLKIEETVSELFICQFMKPIHRYILFVSYIFWRQNARKHDGNCDSSVAWMIKLNHFKYKADMLSITSKPVIQFQLCFWVSQSIINYEEFFQLGFVLVVVAILYIFVAETYSW